MDESVSVTEYRIDAADRIVMVNSVWEEFARQNHGSHLLPPAILGELLWDSIQESTTRTLYRTIIGRIRDGSGPAEFLFRCDSPGARRLLAMRIALAEGGAVKFSVQPVAEQEREEVSLLNPFMSRSRDILPICSWCLRVSVREGEWTEVENAVGQIRLFEAAEPPRLSHGICPECRIGIESAIVDPHPVPGGEKIDLGIVLPG